MQTCAIIVLIVSLSQPIASAQKDTEVEDILKEILRFEQRRMDQHDRRADIREYGKELDVRQLSLLAARLMDEAEVESPPTEDYLILRIGPTALIPGLYERAPERVLPTVSRMERSARETLAARDKQGQIDPIAERILTKKCALAFAAVSEALETSLAHSDVELCWKLIKLSSSSPLVYVRSRGVLVLEKLICEKGSLPAPRDELREVVSNIEKKESAFVDISNRQDSEVAPFMSKVILKHAERISECLK